MSIGPVVLKPRTVPFLTIACVILVVYFLVKALLFGGAVAAFSLLLGVIVAIVGLWALWSASRSSVIIDSDQFTVIRRGRVASFDRSAVAEVDLAGFHSHLTMTDGSGVKLPLEGDELIEASLLLCPRRYEQAATNL